MKSLQEKSLRKLRESVTNEEHHTLLGLNIIRRENEE